VSAWGGDWLVPEWPAPPGIRACVTARQGGVSRAPFDSFNLGDHVGDEPASVAWNRQHLQDVLGCQPVWLEQVHSSVAVQAAPGNRVTADASWSETPGLACAVLTADCLPMNCWCGWGRRSGRRHSRSGPKCAMHSSRSIRRLPRRSLQVATRDASWRISTSWRVSVWLPRA